MNFNLLGTRLFLSVARMALHGGGNVLARIPHQRPTIGHHKKGVPMYIETEAERRYEMDQIIASARLEGKAPSPEILQITDKYVRGEITRQEMHRQNLAYINNAAGLTPGTN